jgi:hypothetical protein
MLTELAFADTHDTPQISMRLSVTTAFAFKTPLLFPERPASQVWQVTHSASTRSQSPCQNNIIYLNQ